MSTSNSAQFPQQSLPSLSSILARGPQGSQLLAAAYGQNGLSALSAQLGAAATSSRRPPGLAMCYDPTVLEQRRRQDDLRAQIQYQQDIANSRGNPGLEDSKQIQSNSPPPPTVGRTSTTPAQNAQLLPPAQNIKIKFNPPYQHRMQKLVQQVHFRTEPHNVNLTDILPSFTKSQQSSTLSPMLQQPPTPPQQSGLGSKRTFFSPLFNSSKPIEFYGRMRDAIVGYAVFVDTLEMQYRRLVWREILQIAGLPYTYFGSEDLPMVEPMIQQILSPTQTLNLAVLELIYAAFLQAQRHHPVVFCHTFVPLEEGEKSDSVWGTSLQATLLQLNMLCNWIPVLEQLPHEQKHYIWDTCKLMPSFQNYSTNSFKKTIMQWAANPIDNISSISTMFSALGFLYYNQFLKGEFFYPGLQVSVFKYAESLHNKRPTIKEEEM